MSGQGSLSEVLSELQPTLRAQVLERLGHAKAPAVEPKSGRSKGRGAKREAAPKAVQHIVVNHETPPPHKQSKPSGPPPRVRKKPSLAIPEDPSQDADAREDAAPEGLSNADEQDASSPKASRGRPPSKASSSKTTMRMGRAPSKASSSKASPLEASSPKAGPPRASLTKASPAKKACPSNADATSPSGAATEGNAADTPHKGRRMIPKSFAKSQPPPTDRLDGKLDKIKKGWQKTSRDVKQQKAELADDIRLASKKVGWAKACHKLPQPAPEPQQETQPLQADEEHEEAAEEEDPLEHDSPVVPSEASPELPAPESLGCLPEPPKAPPGSLQAVWNHALGISPLCLSSPSTAHVDLSVCSPPSVEQYSQIAQPPAQIVQQPTTPIAPPTAQLAQIAQPTAQKLEQPTAQIGQPTAQNAQPTAQLLEPTARIVQPPPLDQCGEIPDAQPQLPDSPPPAQPDPVMYSESSKFQQ